VIRTLTPDDFESLYAAFQSAFSDYVVKLTLTREQFAEMITRRGWRPELSVGAFEGDLMIAFTINGVDGDRAYDSGTGVVPTHRRTGLARALMERSFELLRDCSEYVLEVIDANTRAADLYRSLGFRETRGLQCWAIDIPDASASEFPLRLLDGNPIAPDIEPSWQNSTASIRRARDPHVVLGNEDAYAVVFPSNGDLSQLLVRRETRRRGLGTRLVRSAAAVAGKPLRIVNVDESDRGFASFLESLGARRTVRQLEMVRTL